MLQCQNCAFILIQNKQPQISHKPTAETCLRRTCTLGMQCWSPWHQKFSGAKLLPTSEATLTFTRLYLTIILWPSLLARRTSHPAASGSNDSSAASAMATLLSVSVCCRLTNLFFPVRLSCWTCLFSQIMSVLFQQYKRRANDLGFLKKKQQFNCVSKCFLKC